MWSGAMSLQRGIVFVLLIDEESPRLGFVPVDLIHQAARFLARFFGKLRKNWDDIGVVPSFRHPGHCQNHHSYTPYLVFDLWAPGIQRLDSRLSAITRYSFQPQTHLQK